jgi:hypothetical protein
MPGYVLGIVWRCRGLAPVYQKEILHVNEMGFGILRSAPGIGALLTLGLLAFLPLRTYPGRKLFLCVTGFAVSIIIFGLSKTSTCLS